MRSILLPAVLAALVACGPANQPTPPSVERAPAAADSLLLDATVSRGRLLLANRDTAVLYFTVFERRFTAVVNWRPCAVPDTCRGVRPGATREIALDSIPGYGPEAEEAVVYWWRLVPGREGRHQPDTVRSRIVRLRPAP